jgi:hypothetical protein
LQDERFTSLDRTLQQVIETLLQHLVKIHVKLELIAVQNDASPTTGPIQGDVRTSTARDYGQGRDLEQKINNALLHVLHFPTMTFREQEIAEAHQRTFSWIFYDLQEEIRINPSQGHRPWSNFVKWLREDGGVYWINGKAGSGKSTLMRFIVQSRETQLHLRHWAIGSDLQVSSFYFWNGGSELQRSRKGFLQSLLFDILKERPELTRSVFDIEWKDFETTYNTFNVLKPRKWEISTKRLEQCFTKLISLTTLQFRLCFFIDGLDESQEPPEELLELVEMASSSPFVKVCLSSRPWLVFEEAFEAVPSLRLQDLSLPDIQLYVHENLRLNRRMKKLEESNPSGAASLVTNIVTKADGVFLWVRIVIKSLLDGLRNRDEISDLQRRLDVLPPDLDALYSHMIDHIDPLYAAQASQIFQIFEAASDILLSLSVLQLELAVSADYPTAMSKSSKATQTMTDSEIFERCDRMAAHLKSRCEGLLEVHHDDLQWESLASYGTMELSSDAEAAARIGDEVERRLRVSWRVSYLHRTVKDFLKTDRTRAKLQRSASLPNFDPYLSLLMSFVIDWKRSLRSHCYDIREGTEDRSVILSTMDVIDVCGEIKDQHRQSIVLLHEFYKLVSQWLTVTKLPSDSTLSSTKWEALFLTLATCKGLWKYVDETLIKAQGPFLCAAVRPLLCVALDIALPPIIGKIGVYRDIYRLTPEMVDLLLSLGAKPNAEFKFGKPLWGKTIWGSFLGGLLDRIYGLDPWLGKLDKLNLSTPIEIKSDNYLLRASRVLQSLIRSGVDIGLRCHGQSLSDTVIDTVIDKVFSLRLPGEATVLRELVKETRESRMRLELSGARKRPLEPDTDQLPSKRQEVTTCDVPEDYSGE